MRSATETNWVFTDESADILVVVAGAVEVKTLVSDRTPARCTERVAEGASEVCQVAKGIECVGVCKCPGRTAQDVTVSPPSIS